MREFDYSCAGKTVHVTDAVDSQPGEAARAQVRAGGRRERRRQERGARVSHRPAEHLADESTSSPDVEEAIMADRVVKLRVKRQDGPERAGARKRWEEFDVPWQPQMNVISALMEIQKSPDDRRRQDGGAGGVGVRAASKRCAARARW